MHNPAPGAAPGDRLRRSRGSDRVNGNLGYCYRYLGPPNEAVEKPSFEIAAMPPLRVDLLPTAQREASHPLVLEIRKHGFDRGDPAAVDLTASRRIKLPPHAFDWAVSLV